MQSNNKTAYQQNFSNYVEKKKTAVELSNYIGQFLFKKGIELVFFRKHMEDLGLSEMVDLFDNYAPKTLNKHVDIHEALTIVKVLDELYLAPSKLDIGKIADECNQDKPSDLKVYLSEKLSAFTPENATDFQEKDVVLYGFGRIGRLVVRELINQAGKGQQLLLKAIVLRSITPEQMIKRADLLRNDSVHGYFKGSIELDVENKCIIINGHKIQFIVAKSPSEIDYTTYGIDNALLIDSTGIFKDKTALSQHLQSKGISKVLLTAPGNEIPNVVYGINHKNLDLQGDDIFSAASCTTNAISPVLKVLEDSFEIKSGHIETVHSYTNDQNLLDNMHSKPRRGRSAAINMVITSTGAGKAVTKVIPSLKDKLTANAVRVPTPNCSLAIIHLELNAGVDVEAINQAIRKSAFQGALVNQINYQNNPELVSNDIIGNDCPSVFDSQATIVSKDGKKATVYVWYDNEYGYTKQVIRLAKYIAKVRRLIYY